MSEHEKRSFPEWERLYGQTAVETMPWFTAALDEDLREALDRLDLRGGARVLDLGTGPGTQAMELARRGFVVTATDISEEAVRLARQKSEWMGLAIDWRRDDVLDTQLAGPFDIVLDRGCFHVLEPGRRQDYVRTVVGLMADGGLLLLKCFSRRQEGEQGPYRFTAEEIREIFGGRFDVLSVKETVYQGTLDPLPRALFCVMGVRKQKGLTAEIAEGLEDRKSVKEI